MRHFEVMSYGKKVMGDIIEKDNWYWMEYTCDDDTYTVQMMPVAHPSARSAEWFGERMFASHATMIASGNTKKLFNKEKPAVRLYNWYIQPEQEPDGTTWWYACGVVIGHPRLYDSSWMRRSSGIVEYHIDKGLDEIVLETHNSIFHCPLNECDYSKESTYGYIPELQQYRTIFEPYQDKYEIDPQTALLVLSDRREYYFRYCAVQIGERQRIECEMWPHIGTFQDSVLISPKHWEEYLSRIDIRYFPHSGWIEFYATYLPEGYRFYIENQGDRTLYIDCFDDQRIVLRPGERKEYCESAAVPRSATPPLAGGDLYPAGICLWDDVVTPEDEAGGES